MLNRTLFASFSRDKRSCEATLQEVLVDKYVRVGLHVRMYPFFSSEAIAVSFGENRHFLRKK